MARFTRIRTIMAVGGMMLVVRPALGQAPPVPPPPPPSLPGPGAVPGELNNLSRQMAEQVRHLGEDIATDLGTTPQGKHLVQDTRELGQAVDEFHDAVRDARDSFRVRQAYAGIDTTWHHLQAQLAQPGFATPAVSRATQRVGQIDGQIHQALGINTYPPGYYGPGSAPTGLAEAKRLGLALVDRAQAVAAMIRVDLPGATETRLLQAAINLAQAADAFHDSLDLNASPDLARNGFAGVAAQSDELDTVLAASVITPRVRASWQAYEAAYVLMRQTLGLPIQAEDRPETAIPASGPSPVVTLADQLVAQVGSFLQTFNQTGESVPEAGLIQADLTRLRDLAVVFQQGVARGLDPNRLAYEFRDVDAAWQRVARRTNRIARGRLGPGLQQINQMGQTCTQIHQLLGLPGYPPTVLPFPG